VREAPQRPAGEFLDGKLLWVGGMKRKRAFQGQLMKGERGCRKERTVKSGGCGFPSGSERGGKEIEKIGHGGNPLTCKPDEGTRYGKKNGRLREINPSKYRRQKRLWDPVAETMAGCLEGLCEDGNINSILLGTGF